MCSTFLKSAPHASRGRRRPGCNISIAARGCPDTGRGGALDGVDQPSTAGFDAPLPNAPRTLAKSNAVALDAQQWVLRLPPTERALTAPSRSWEQERIVAYVAAYTKEMAASAEVIRRLEAADRGGPPMNAPEPSGPEPKRARVA